MSCGAADGRYPGSASGGYGKAEAFEFVSALGVDILLRYGSQGPLSSMRQLEMAILGAITRIGAI
jgi:hypothetical protein